MAVGRIGAGTFGAPRSRVRRPWLRSTPTSNSTGNPTIGTHLPGDLLIQTGTNGSGGTIPTADDSGEPGFWGSPVAAAAHPGTGQAHAVYIKQATRANHAIQWTNANGLRESWVVANGVYDTGTIQIVHGTNTTLDWPQLLGLKPCLILAHVVTNGAQTSFANVVTATGLTQRHQRTTASAAWAADSANALLTSFDPANTTFDSATAKWTAIVIPIRGRA